MDTKEYLRDKIQHYDLLVTAATKDESTPLKDYIHFIQELKIECSNHLSKILEIDTITALQAKTSVGLFPHTS